ncbi:MAG: DNA-processing protein DprA [Phycisphaerales bacterium]|jgi:DNA processing protein|nr:DNA-processing protein DprA [Phycisphaerales bacterium]
MRDGVSNPPSNESARAALRLALAQGVGPVIASRLLARFGSADRVLGASPAALAEVEGVGPKRAESIARSLAHDTQEVDRELERAHRLGARILCLGDPDFPPTLAAINDPPTVLFVRGTLEPFGRDAIGLGVVGSRRCTHYGLEQAKRLAGVVSTAGVCIVSGGARGIDTQAHRAAIEMKGRTIVVLGSGLAQAYPPENAELFERIVREGYGCVLSELPMDTPPKRENFPGRNRLISGLSVAVLVIEAPERSGALITARVAIEEQGREVLVVPGRVDSQASAGGHELIRQGATLVATPRHVLEAVRDAARRIVPAAASLVEDAAREASEREARDPAHDAASSGPARQSTQVSREPAEPQSVLFASAAPSSAPAPDDVLRLLDRPRTVDELAALSGLDAGEVRTRVTLLEIRGDVRRSGSHLIRVI